MNRLSLTITCAMGLAITIAAVGCSSSPGDESSNGSSGSSGNDATGTCKTGTNAAWATPSGTPFALPAGIVLDGDITGNYQPNCDDLDFVEYGNEGLFVCIGLKNTGGTSAVVTFPAGLTFLPNDATVEDGMIMQSHDLTLPATTTTYFKFALFGTNQFCGDDDFSTTFTFGNVTNNSAVLEVISLGQKDDLTELASNASELLQMSLWDITDGSGLTAAHRAALMQ